MKEKRLKPIKNCRSCMSTKLESILSLGNFYLSYFEKEDKNTPKSPLSLVLCKECSLVQLRHTVPQSLLYTDSYGYKSGVNKTMRNELKGIVRESLEKIKDFRFKELIALDIGANDGTLLKFYPKHVFKVAVEPIKKYALECRSFADVAINDFFNYNSYIKTMKNKKAHLVTAISCFYDIDNPNQFVSDVKKILHKNGVFVIQQNYLVDMLKNNAFDNIVHEHLLHYSLLSLENLLRRHGLIVFDVKLNSINGGSFRTYICKKGKREVNNSVLRLRESELRLGLDKKEIYQDFAARIKIISEQILDFIKKKVKMGKIIMVYGASTRGNTLLQYCKLDNRLIKAAVERNPEKWGKKISSSGIPIISEERARKEKPDYMLVLPWFFKEEFLKREKEYLKNGRHFIFPLPNLEVL